MQFNKNLKERKIGYFFLGIWLLIFLFYSTWDGWLFEWRSHGLSGPNQHFDLNIFDMDWDIVEGKREYRSTNNLHNILFLCYFQLFLCWSAFITGKESLRQGAMALVGLSIGATVATLDPSDHLCPVQIAYDIVHVSGIIAAGYLFYHYDLQLKRTIVPIFATWGVYILSRICVSKWPYWEYPLAYYSINQINEMPFDAFGLEYASAVVLLLVMNKIILTINGYLPNRMHKSLCPIVVATFFCIIMQIAGLVEVQNIDMSGR